MTAGAEPLEGAHQPRVTVLDLIELLQEAIGETRAACDGLRLATIGLAEEDGADVSGLTALAEIVLERMDDLAANPAVTLNIYAHILPGQQEGAGAIVDAALSAALQDEPQAPQKSPGANSVPTGWDEDVEPLSV